MAIYGNRELDLSIGKDIPAMGPWKNFNPNLVGPGVGPGGLLRGIKEASRFVAKNYKFFTRIAVIPSGTGIAGLEIGSQTPNRYFKKSSQAYRPAQSRSNYRRKQGRIHPNRCCKCCHD